MPEGVDLTLLGNRWAWVQEWPVNRARVAQVVARGAPVAIFQEAGRTDWGAAALDAEQFKFIGDLDKESLRSVQALIAISDRVLPDLPMHLREYTLLYRPPTLTLGVACRRQVEVEALNRNVRHFFAEHGWIESCLTAVATSIRRRHHGSLIDFAEERSIPLLAYPHDKLALLQPTMRRQTARISRCSEAAAMLAAGVKELCVPRQAFEGMTLALARRPWA